MPTTQTRTTRVPLAPVEAWAAEWEEWVAWAALTSASSLDKQEGSEECPVWEAWEEAAVASREVASSEEVRASTLDERSARPRLPLLLPEQLQTILTRDLTIVWTNTRASCLPVCCKFCNAIQSGGI